MASPFNETLYKFPFQLFMILEKMPVTVFTSNAVTSNHYIMYIPKQWKYSLLAALKYETSTSLTFLVESTIVDTYKYNLFTNIESYDLSVNRMLRIDNYFSLFNRVRYTILESSGKQPLYSSTTFFKNAVWLEREFLEMYGPTINTIYDSRNLLLEYSFTDNPMLKTYPTEGFVDIYYDFFRDQLCYVNHDYVEL